MSIFTFNGLRYSADVLEKLSAEGHNELVETSSVVAGTMPASGKIIAYKYDGAYHLLLGKLSDTQALQEKVKLIVVSKHTLKKALYVEPVKQTAVVISPPRRNGSVYNQPYGYKTMYGDDSYYRR